MISDGSMTMTEEGIIIKLGKRFTITLPKEIREKLPLKEGNRLKLVRKSSHLEIYPLDDDPHKRLAQLLNKVDYRKVNLNKESEEFLFSEVGDTE